MAVKHITNVSQKQNIGTLHNESPHGFVITDRSNLETVLDRYRGYPNELIDTMNVIDFETTPELEGNRFVEAMIRNVFCGELSPTMCYAEREYVSTIEVVFFTADDEDDVVQIDCSGFIDRESAPKGFFKIK